MLPTHDINVVVYFKKNVVSMFITFYVDWLID